MNPVEIPEVVRTVRALILERRPTEPLDLRVVRASGGGDLGVAVDHGAPGPPETVPHKERILSLWVGYPGALNPLERHRDVIVHLLRGKRERIVIVEDDEAVEAVGLG